MNATLLINLYLLDLKNVHLLIFLSNFKVSFFTPQRFHYLNFSLQCHPVANQSTASSNLICNFNLHIVQPSI